ncbi:MAG: zinc ribbon domain-containing protein [Candidatus Sumerlaeia bacterium]
MHPELDKLLKIQELDAEIHKLQAELKRYPALKKAHRDEVKRITAKLDTAREKRRQLELKIRESEHNVEALRQDLVKLETQLSNVKNQKEYEAVNQEISERQEKISLADEVGLEHLEQEEKLDSEIAEQEKSLELRSRESDREIERIEGREKEKNALLGRLKEQREKLAADVETAVLQRYERLNTKHPGNAVVPVEGGNCAGCHMHLLPRVIQDVARDETITECASCHRLLYS